MHKKQFQSKFVIYPVSFIAGYLIGRAGHVINTAIPALNHSYIPHHWILGMGINYINYQWINRTWIGYFGLGLIVSDLNDMLHMRIFQPDDTTHVNFWGID